MANVYDCIRAAALIVGFAVGVQQRKNAVFADIVFTGWLGLCFYLLPENFLGQQLVDGTEIDKISVYGCRAIGSWLLGPLVMWILCRKSRDECVIGALLWSRIVGMMMTFILMLYSHLTYKFFSDRHLWFTVLFCGLVWLSSVIQLVLTRPPVGRREEKGAISTITRLYFLMMFIFAMTSMAFPKFIFSTITDKDLPLYHYLVRICGALMFGNVFIIWYVPCFRSDEDRKSFFISQLVLVTLDLGSMFFGYWDDAFNRTQLLYQLGLMLPAVLVLAGLLLMVGEERRVATNSYSLRSRRS